MRAMLLFPSSGGGVAARSVNSCEATLDAQTGWSEMCLTTPSAPIKGCLRRNFLEVASTPPLEEGNSSRFYVLSHWAFHSLERNV